MEIDILSTLLNTHRRYNIHNIHDSLLSERRKIMLSLHVQFSSGITIWQRVLKRVVNILNVHGNSVNK